MWKVRHTVNVIFFFFLATCSLAQTEDEIKENAEKLFESEEYVQATSLYLRLLSLSPKNADYNFRYGTCLLFNSYQKKEAIRYLNFAVTESGIDPRAYYFHGKALHLNYQFEEAKVSYRKYLEKRTQKDKRYEVERQIEMCDNGEKLLTTFTDIIVSEKKEIDNDKFFRLYNDAQTLGGTILVSADFQSKLDKKMGHVPIVHFPPNAKAIYYSSYGDNGSTGKDIYIRRRLPDGGWGDPQLLPGQVNTDEDEDFPYMHPGGDFLYFSSKGHNSMGGYDVFFSRYNPDNNSFGRPENVDFAISSPDDDLFYVVDSLYKTAYFASARQSQNGKLHVYRVRVARIPVQEVIIMGDYLSEINPENKEMTVKVTSFTNGAEVGKIVSNSKGKYSFVFPKGGKYNYEVSVGGSDDVYKFVVEVPFLDEFRPLKQKAIHTTVDGNEIVQIINLFNEKVEGAEALMAEVIRKHAELEVNIDKFDLKEIDSQAQLNNVLAEMGFTGMSLTEVSGALEELAIAEKLKLDKADRIESNINNEIIQKTEALSDYTDRIEELRQQANQSSDPETKYEILLQIKSLESEALVFAREIESLDDLRDRTLASIGKPSESGIGKIEMLENQFNALMSGDKESDALKLLERNKVLINTTRSQSPEKVVNDLIEQSLKITAEIDDLREKERQLESEKRDLENEIILLNRNITGAKKKELETLQEQLNSKQNELDLVEDVLNSTKDKIQEKRHELSILDNNVATLQKSILIEAGETPESSELQASLKKVREMITSAETSPTNQEIAVIEKNNPELNPENNTSSNLAESKFDKIENGHVNREQEIVSNSNLTEGEKFEALLVNNKTTELSIDKRIEAIDKLLKDDDNASLKDEKEKLGTYLTELNRADEVYQNKLDSLKNLPLDVAISIEDVLKEIVPSYEKELATIEANNNLTEKEKLLKIQEKDNEVITKLNTELQKLNSQIQNDPDNTELIARTEVVEAIKEMKGQEIAERSQMIEAIIETQVELDPLAIRSDLLNELSGNYTTDKNAIENSGKSELDKSVDLLTLEVKRLNELEGKKLEIEQQIENNGEDKKLQAQLTVAKQLIEEQKVIVEQQNHLMEVLVETNTNDTLQETNDVTLNPETVKAELLVELSNTFTSDKEVIENSDKSAYDKGVEILTLELQKLKAMEDKKSEVEHELQRRSEDVKLQAQLTALNSLIDEQNTEINKQKSRTIEAITSEQIDQSISRVDRTYHVEVGELKQSTTSSKYSEIAKREVELQEAIEKSLQDKRKALSRKYSVSAELELAILENALIESNEREATAIENEQNNVVAANPEKQALFLEQLRKNTLGEDDHSMDAVYTTRDELNAQDQMLAYYESQLFEKIESTSSQLDLDPNNSDLTAELTWLEEEKEKVQQKRRSVSVSIGELETNVIVEHPVRTNSSDDPELNKLNARKETLQNELKDSELSSDQRREIENELKEVESEQMIRENELVNENIEVAIVENRELSNALEFFANNDDPVVEKTLKLNQTESEEIEDLVQLAERAKTKEEKNYILDKADNRQTVLNDAMRTAVQDRQRKEIETKENIELETSEDLEKKRRTFSVQIGDLTTEILRKEEQIEKAKKKELPELMAEKEQLINERSLIESKLHEVEDRLLQRHENVPVVTNVAVGQQISFNEERKVAATDEYEDYYNLATDALELEQQISNLENDLKEEQRRINELLAVPGANSGDEAIQMSVQKIKSIQADIDRLSIELIQRKYEADQVLPSNTEEAMKMQNLVIRGVQPLKTIAVAAALIQMPSNGLAIDENANSVYSASNPIPVGVENPSGLVYRVQIGAFARPIPQDLFKEFNPVSGEKIGETNITRYMAGFFNNSNAVVDAREKIRSLGYSDAFVVAYCDGERIQFGEAKRREAEGTCVPKGENELMLEMAVKTAEKLGLPTTNEVQEVPEMSYNQAPGAAKADPIELKKGLFYTVQIGVFNRPVGPEYTYGYEDLLTIRLPNGQIRYATGMFNSVEEALPRREDALQRGVKGAFVTAYFKGERITLAEAKRLFDQQGSSILQSEMEKDVPPIVEIPPVKLMRTDTVTRVNVTPVVEEERVQRIQIVTKKQFDEFPRDVLNRYNAEGNFYFDAVDRRVKSIIYWSKDDLPRIWNFRDDIDTLFLSMDDAGEVHGEILDIRLTEDAIPGDFMDWLMRFNYRKEFLEEQEGRTIRIYGIEPNKVLEVQGIIRKFALEAVVVEETEYELEIEEK